ncbi:MAG: family 10 glycosylhydrolase, partial [Bacteroidales bacterium]
MNQYSFFRIVMLLCFLFVFGVSYGAPKREFRGAWIHIVGNNVIRTMSTQQVQKMLTDALDAIQDAGCNAVIFQVRPAADAFYYSSIEPWSRYLTGVQGKVPEPFWDPLQFMIEQTHKRGMEIHAWCNPYRVTLNANDTLCKEHLYFKNPDIFVKYGKQIYFNPAEPASREFTVKVVADIVSRYDIEAIHFDDYFYPYPIAGEKFDDDKAFKKYAAQQGFSNK